jgi:cardiolipin synthase
MNSSTFIQSAVVPMQTALPVVYIILSLIVTTHVLRFKTDPRASLLWIALVWFAPLLGAFFYYMFGINRISRRAQRLGVSDNPTEIDCTKCGHDFENDKYWQGFCHLGCKITGVHQVGGNRVEILEGIGHIHNEFIDAINSAQKSVFLTTFIFKHDDLGKRVVSALVDAKARGVDVYISLDGFGNILARSWTFRELKKRGLNVHRFLHSYWPWRMPYLNLRNHRKILIADEKIAFTGSLNIGRVGNLETHFKLQGPIINHMCDAFLENWSMSTKAPRPTLDLDNSQIQSGDILARGIKSGPAYPMARTRTFLSGALSAASTSVRIVTPYFVPDKAMLSDIELASLRGVNVELVLPNKSNHRITDWAARRQLKTLLATGCKIYLRDDAFDHSKLMTIDNKWVLIGSSNWDSRSLRLNFEFDIECISEKFAISVNKLIDDKRTASRLLQHADYLKRPRLVVLRDSAARLLLPYL